jgi:TonB family protein
VSVLEAVPSAGLLAGVWRLLVPAERREEFVGDLVEQAHDELAGRSPAQVGLWLWGQTLHSAPSLLVARARRLSRRAMGYGGRRLVAQGAPGLLGGRLEQRSWSVPMAVSVSAHVLALAALALLTVGQLDPIDAPWVSVALRRAFAPAMPTMAAAPAKPESLAVRSHRKAHPRPVAAPVAAQPLLAAQAPAEAPIEDPIVHNVVVVLPPVVAEKRCLSCPTPRLPPAFVRLGAPQQVLVKTCVGSKGDVTSVKVVRGLSPDADAGVVETVRRWRFSPHAVGDHPVPFCYPTRFLFTMN